MRPIKLKWKQMAKIAHTSEAAFEELRIDEVEPEDEPQSEGNLPSDVPLWMRARQDD